MSTDVEAKLSWATDAFARLRKAIGERIIGQSRVVDEVLWALIAGGHVLLEGAPGLGKTLLVRTLSECLDLSFSRIQFTPDLMPSDVVGTNVLVMDAAQRAREGSFALQKGPIFGQILLADEINRATPKTQSALLEAMAEHAVTLAGIRHPLDEPFCVLATENPIEMEGTYPLPEAQLDRFLLKVEMETLSEDDLCRVLDATTGQPAGHLAPVLKRNDVLELRTLCRDVIVAEPIVRYAARLVRATDPNQPDASPTIKRSVRYGAGVRGAQALVLAAKAVALSQGRGHVAFDDIKRIAYPSLSHRIIRSFEGEVDGTASRTLLSELLASVEMRPKHLSTEGPL